MTHLDLPLMLAATDPKAITVGQWISAALTIVLTIAIVLSLRWALRRRKPVQFTDPSVRTRVRLLQRMGVTLIILIGLASAAAQIGILDGIANTVLAGSAITAVIVGFAARSTLANSLAGVVLTITQPVRVGDNVKVGDHEGTVEDVTLSATVLRTVHGTIIRIPNELMAQSVVYNDTILDNGVIPEVSVLVPFGADMPAAVDVALDLDGVELARHMGVEGEGWNRLMVRGPRCAPGDRIAAEARMRLALIDALTRAGMMSRSEPGQETGRAV
ncbi:MAG: mechanosensitive ion channel [Solirubrobacteraceae bacterium]|nr:mechanosensitive ion channel [Solirubrobacteraceae bacterium]